MLAKLLAVFQVIERLLDLFLKWREKQRIKKEVQRALDEASMRTEEQAREIEQEVLSRFDPDAIPEWMWKYRRN